MMSSSGAVGSRSWSLGSMRLIRKERGSSDACGNSEHARKTRRTTLLLPEFSTKRVRAWFDSPAVQEWRRSGESRHRGTTGVHCEA
eukprot:754981-Hanusia_phi.AAC.4